MVAMAPGSATEPGRPFIPEAVVDGTRLDLLAGCDTQAVSTQGVTVELDAPLGDRALLDGSCPVR